MRTLELEELATFYDHIYRSPVGKYVIHVCDSAMCWMEGHQRVIDYISERAKRPDGRHQRRRAFHSSARLLHRLLRPRSGHDDQQAGLREAHPGKDRQNSAQTGSRSRILPIGIAHGRISTGAFQKSESRTGLPPSRNTARAAATRRSKKYVAAGSPPGSDPAGGRVRSCAGAAGRRISQPRKNGPPCRIPGAFPRYLAANADEMEPGTFKDRMLLHVDPHCVIEGMILSAMLFSASKAFFFVRPSYESSAVDSRARTGDRTGRPAISERISWARIFPLT